MHIYRISARGPAFKKYYMGVQIPQHDGAIVRGRGGPLYKYRETLPSSVQKRLNRSSPRKHVFDGGAHWRYLANTIEPSMCGSDVAFLSNYKS